MDRRTFISETGGLIGASALWFSEHKADVSLMDKWRNTYDSISKPFIKAWLSGNLNEFLASPDFDRRERMAFASLESVARFLYAHLQIMPSMSADLISALEHNLRPGHPDSFNWNVGTQPLVDAAILAAAFLQNPKVFVHQLPDSVRKSLFAGWQKALSIKPYESNWLLFAAIIETALQVWDRPFKPEHITHASAQFQKWYVGDAWYGDGPRFHLDYYNSIIIHPFLWILGKYQKIPADFFTQHQVRARRFAFQLCRLAGQDFVAPLGRSLCYRAGLFHHLAFFIRESQTENPAALALFRHTLDGVIRHTLQTDPTGKPVTAVQQPDSGLLRPGFRGFEPHLAESYISHASLYLATWAFLPLGLPDSHMFWKAELAAPDALKMDGALKD